MHTFLQADLWLGISSGLPVIRELEIQTGSQAGGGEATAEESGHHAGLEFFGEVDDEVDLRGGLFPASM